jgi:ankyrin repeat protein
MKDLVVDLNCKGHDNWHALHFACNKDQVEIVEYLLQQPKI